MASKYKILKKFSEEEFRRLTGIRRETFSEMLIVLRAARKKIKVKGGPKDKLSLANPLLLSLEYLREYRTRAYALVLMQICGYPRG